jgi:hypothetical protein
MTTPSPALVAPTLLAARGGERAARLGWAALAATACLLVALVATWPLATTLTSATLLASEHEATTQVFTIWTFWWTADRLAHGLAHYWDAPFFYPNPGVFTYSEPEPLTGLAVSPLWALGAPPALIHNVALLGMLTLNGLFATRLLRTMGLPRGAALLGGMLAVGLPFVARLYGVINLIALFGLFWTLDGLLAFGRTGGWRQAAWAAAGFVATYLTCQQYALMFALFALAAGLLALAQQHWQRAAILRLGLAGLAAGIVVGVVAWPAFSLHQALGLERPDFVVARLSAHPEDFLVRPDTAWLDFPRRRVYYEDTAGLFPGFGLLGLALAGVSAGWRTPAWRRTTGFFAGAALAAALLALGLNLDLAGVQPYALLRAVVPGYSELRSVFRFAVILQAMLALLAAVGLAALAGRFGRAGQVAAGLVAGLALVEYLSVPVPLLAIPAPPHTAWSAWLRDQPDRTAVAHVPFPAGTKVADYEGEAWRMFAQIDHHKPIVNGYSGYFPPDYTPFQLEMAQEFPNHALLCLLNKGLRVDTLVVDQPWLGTHRAAMAEQAAFLQPVYADTQVQIYALALPDAACTRAEGPPP